MEYVGLGFHMNLKIDGEITPGFWKDQTII